MVSLADETSVVAATLLAQWGELFLMDLTY